VRYREAVILIAHTPRHTVFTRFIPVRNKAEARGRLENLL